MKTKIIVLLSVLIFALGMFISCGDPFTSETPDSTSESVSVSESVSASDSASGSTTESIEHTHAFVFAEWITKPTVETAGKAKMKCKADNEEKEEDVPALGDTTVWKKGADVADACVGGEVEYTSEKYGKVKVSVAPHHELGTLVPAKAATCTEEGNVAYYQCSVCNKYFDENGGELTTVTVEKIAHDFDEIVAAKAATCVATGNVEYKECKLCHHKFDKNGAQIANDDVTVPVDASAHDFDELVAAKAATCVATGNVEYKECKLCHHKFDKNGAQIANDDVTVPVDASAHDFDELVAAKAATCVATGNVEYKECKLCHHKFDKNGAQIANDDVTLAIDPTNHNPDAPVAENNKDATCTVPGSYEKVVYCHDCKKELSREKVTGKTAPHTPGEAVKENEKAATCTEKGSYESVVRCSVCNTEISRTTVEVPEKGHTPKAPVKEDVVEATCTKEGSYNEVTYCEVCNEKISSVAKVTPKAPHTPADAVIEGEIKATCTEDGSYSKVVRCSVCNTIIESVAKTTPALGHDYKVVYENVKAATCYEKGSHDERSECTRCHDVKEESVKTGVVDDVIEHQFEKGACKTCKLAKQYTGAHLQNNGNNSAFKGVLEFDEAGRADDTCINTSSDYSNKLVRFTWVDYATGKFTLFTSYDSKSGSGYGYGEDEGYGYGYGSSSETKTTTKTMYGYMDKETGALVVNFGKDETIANSTYLFVPSATVLEDSAYVTSTLDYNYKIHAMSATTANGTYSVFVENGKVYFGVTFTDVSGNAVSAKDLTKNVAEGFTFLVKKNGVKVAGYGKNGDVVSLDRFAGVYDSINEGEPVLTINGMGKATLDEKEYAYVYSAIDNKLHFSLYDENGRVVAFHYVDFVDGTYRKATPMNLVMFDTNGHGTIKSVEVNTNTHFSLAGYTLPDTETQEFKGWSLNDELIEGDYFLVTDEITLVAVWADLVPVTVIDEKTGDENNIYAAVGDKILSKLPENTADDFKGYFLVLEDGTETEVTSEDVFFEEDVDGVTVKAKYYTTKPLTVVIGNGFENKVINVKENSKISEALAADEDITNSLVIKDGYKFVGWFTDEACTIELKDTVMSEAITAVYAKWTWAGNVKFIEQKKYPFVYVSQKNAWKSTNEGKGSTSSVLEIVVTSGVANIEFDYWISSENGYDFATIYYYKDGVRKELPTKGKNIEESNAQHLSTTLVYTGETDISLRISYSKDSSGNRGIDAIYVANLTINGVAVFAQSPLNPDAVGTFTATDGTKVTLTAGGGITVGNETVTYTTVKENVVGVNLSVGYREITLNKEAKTCVIAIPKVKVTYALGGHGEDIKEDVDKFSSQTVTSDVPAAEGYIFRGWYKEATFATKVAAGSSFTAEADVTFYAKWDKAITVTYKYEDGTHADEEAKLYANDSITVKAVDFKFGEKVFAGWFTKTAAGEYGSEIKSGTVLTDDVVLYAKWVDVSPFYGSYLLVNVSGSVDVTNNDESYALNIDFFGKGKANASIGGFSTNTNFEIKYVDESKKIVSVKAGSYTYYGIYDVASGIIAISKYSYGNTTDLYSKSDFVFMIPYNVAYKTSDFTAYRLLADGKYHVFMTYADKNNENVNYSLFTDANALYVNATVKGHDDGVLTVAEIKDALNVKVYNGETLVKEFAKTSSSFTTAIDGFKGFYTGEGGTLYLNGAGVAKYGEKVGTYAHQEGAGENVFDAYFNNKKEYVQFTVLIDEEFGNTYELLVPEVTVTYNYMGNGENVTETVPAKVAYTVSTVKPTAEGFTFRGWYADEECKTAAKSSYTLTDNLTLYAKWSPAVTLKFDYNGLDKEAVVIANKYAEDKVSGIPSVTEKYGELVFAGWFLKNEDGTWGEEASTSKVLTGDLTYYAKWIEAAKAYGTYKGFYVQYGHKNISKTASDLSEIFKVTADGTCSGNSTGKLSDEESLIVDGAFTSLKYYTYFNNELGVVVIANINDNSIGAQMRIGFRDYTNVTGVNYSCFGTYNTEITAWFTVKYKDGTSKNLFIYNSVLYVDVTWTGNVSAGLCYNESNLVMYDKNGTAIAGKLGDSMLLSDGTANTYTGSEGDIISDGFGTLTIGEEKVSYAYANGKFTYVLNNRQRVFTVSGTAYTFVADGYEGEWTLPDGAGTITLDGFGGAGEGKTYVVSGITLTIYEGENSTSYGIGENKTLLGKSVFAGKTFIGTYYSDWDTCNDVLRIVFSDSSSISGVIYSGNGDSYYFNFTAELSGNTLTFIFGKCVESNATGKTLKATISGDTITIVSGGTYSSSTYTFTKNGFAKCEGFSL